MSKTVVDLVQGDITEHAADAIVNAANSTLQGGGGVDGAIHAKGGPAILAECRRIRERQGGCPPGEAVITTAGKLPAKYVIHTVGPVWHRGAEGEPEVLKKCYLHSLALAVEHQATTIAFPSISTGVYGYPVKKAAEVAVAAVEQFLRAHPGKLERITWVLFDPETYQVYKEALRASPVS